MTTAASKTTIQNPSTLWGPWHKIETKAHPLYGLSLRFLFEELLEKKEDDHPTIKHGLSLIYILLLLNKKKEVLHIWQGALIEYG